MTWQPESSDEFRRADTGTAPALRRVCEICDQPIESGALPVYDRSDGDEPTGWIHGDVDCSE
jgi:hypothetical protein